MEKYLVVFEKEFEEDSPYTIQLQTNSLVKAVESHNELKSCNGINDVKILEVREIKFLDNAE